MKLTHWLLLLSLLTLLVACGNDGGYSDAPHDANANGAVTEDEIPAVEDGAATEALIADFRQLIETAVAEEDIPGVAVALVQGDEIIFAEGFGVRDVDDNRPVTTDTLFHIGSTTKSMTAMLIAILVDEGYLDWDTPVVEIYPDFELSDPAGTETVTMRHLLSMTSGIPDEAEEEFPFEEETAEAIFDLLPEVELLDEPGEAYSYSNVAVSAAGYIGVIAATGSDDNLYAGYADLLQQYLLDPIGMDDALVYATAAQSDPNYARSYYWENGLVLAEWFDHDGDSLAPSGVLKADVEDMAKYVLTQLNDGVAPDGVQVVSAENLQETRRPLLDEYALGWQITDDDGLTIIWHDGSYDEFGSVIGFIPELDIGFVVLTNCIDCAEDLLEAAPTAVADLAR